MSKYRFNIRESVIGGPHIKLQRNLFWKFWTTVQEVIPTGGDSVESKVAWAKEFLWKLEQNRIKDEEQLRKLSGTYYVVERNYDE